MTENNTNSILALGRIPHDNIGDREALESVVANWMTICGQAKWPRGLQHFENASFLCGNHLTRFYYTTGGTLGIHRFGINDQTEVDHLVAKVADNRLIRPVENVVSMLNEVQPQPRVEPNSELPEDEDAAALAEIVMTLLWEKPLGMPRKLREAAMLACIAAAVVEIEYGESDVPVEVPKFRLQKRKNPMFGNPEEPEEIEMQVPNGVRVEMRRDIQARVWTPFHITPDPAATCPEDMVWVARQSYVDIDWVKEQFDRSEPGYFRENLDAVGEDASPQNLLYWWAKMGDILDSPSYGVHGGGLAARPTSHTSGSAPGQCVLTVIDVKPTSQFPRGRTLILASGKIIHAGNARSWSERYPWRWHPYAFFGWLKIPGRFWPVAALSEVVPLQKKINAIDALVHINRQYMSIGQWLKPKHCRIPEGMLSGTPGQEVQYNDAPGQRGPERVKHEPLPPELLAERQQLIESIDQIMASGPIEATVSKSAARAGVILDFLRKEKLRSKSAMLQDYESFIETIGQNVLIEIQLNMTEDDPDLTQRIQTAARDHSSLAVSAFTGAALRDHTAVKIDISTALLHTPEARAEKAQAFGQNFGNTMTPAEREGLIRALGLEEFVKNEESASVKRARRMISRVISGQTDAAFTMKGVDVARVMAPVFQREILSDRFYDHEPEIQEALIGLFDQYAAMAAEEQAQMMQLQMAMAQGGQAQPKEQP